MSFSFLTFSLADDSPCLNKDLHYIYITVVIELRYCETKVSSK